MLSKKITDINDYKRLSDEEQGLDENYWVNTRAPLQASIDFQTLRDEEDGVEQEFSAMLIWVKIPDGMDERNYKKFTEAIKNAEITINTVL